MDNVTKAYSQMQSITQETPESTAYNDKLSQIWYRRANMPWHEYAAGMKLGGQEKETPENAASKQRVKDYVEKHKHLFMSKNSYQT